MTPPVGGVLIGLGVLSAVAGAWLLVLERRRRSSQIRRAAGDAGPADDGRSAAAGPWSAASPQTRLSAAVVLLVLGYHMVVWGLEAFHASGISVAFPREWWAYVLGGGAGWVGLSVLTDRLERRSG
jgi:hypothetical protein